MPQNNITRLLDSRKISYTAYDLPVEKLGACETARILNIPVELVFKTIVIKRDKPGKPLLVVIPGDHEVNLKAVAAAIGEKKVHLPTQKEAELMTGLLAGGISPLALINKGFQVLLDQAAQSYEQIHISGGQRGLNIRLPVKALVDLTKARFAEVSSPAPEESGKEEI
jgi:Cys-tRNA(Pro)/Cys-tRNA(Cys) deacylase